MSRGNSSLWNEIVTQFQTSLSENERKLMETSTQEDVIRDVMHYEEIQRNSSRLRRASARIQPLVDVLDSYGKAMDVFVNSHGLIPPLWGSLRVLILTAQRFSDYYHNLIHMLEQFGDILPRFSAYSELLKTHRPLRQALEQAYHQMVIFIFRAKIVFTRSAVHTLIKTTWKSFDKEFEDCVSNLRRYRDLVEDEAKLAGLVEQVQERDRADGERRLAADSRKKLERLESMSNEKNKFENKRWLNARKCSEERRMIQKLRLEGSCEWILEHKELQQWKQNPTTQIFWTHGSPGCGKSFIYSKLLEHIEEEKPAMYFLFCGGDKERVTLSSLFRSWCLQLVEFYSKGMAYLEGFKNMNANSVATDSEIRELLEGLLEVLPSCYLTLDALDECSDNAHFFDRIAFIPNRFKILVTSRTPANIRKRHPEAHPRMQTLQIRPELSKRDIGNFVDRSVANACFEFSDSVVETIRARLVNCDGMFLWVSLMIEELRTQTCDSEAICCLGQLPEGLPQTYERILQRVSNLPKNQRLLTFKVFLWALTVKRPVSIIEMRSLLAIQPFSNSFEKSKLPSVSDDAILCWCGGLIQYRGYDKKIYFTHFTVTEYLEQFIGQQQVFEEILACYDAQELQSNESLAAAVCLRYICYDFVGRIPAPQNYQQATELLNRRDDLLPLLSYATSYWFQHAHSIQPESRVFLLLIHFLSLETTNLAIWWQIYWFSSPESRESLICPQKFSGLHVAAYFGLSNAVLKLLAISNSFPLDSASRSPLWWAASRGHKKTTKILLEFGYDPCHPDRESISPVHRAAALGYSNIFELMIRSCSMPKCSLADREGWTPLHWAAARGQFNVVDALFNRTPAGPFDTRAERCNAGRTPFHLAAFNGHTDILDFLKLPESRFLNQQDDKGWTALHLASIRGHHRAVRKLLGYKTDPHVLDFSGKTAAQKAHAMGNEELCSIITMAMHNTADSIAGKKAERDKAMEAVMNHDMKGLNIRPKKYMNSPHLNDTQDRSALESILNGHISTLNLLFDKGRNWNIVDDRGRNSLHYAVALGRTPVVRRLLDRVGGRRDRFQNFLDEQDDRGWTALHYAASGQSAEICNLLLSHLISSHIRNNEGLTAFDLAVKDGHRQTVETIARFMTMPPDELSKIFGWGFLHMGARYGTLAKPDIESVDPKFLEETDKYQRTPIYRAVEMGHQEISQLLMEKMNLGPEMILELAALAESQDHDASMTSVLLNPLPAGCLRDDGALRVDAEQLFMKCIRRDNVTAITILLQAGIDVDCVDPATYSTSLHAALNSMSTNAATALIRMGANVAIPDSFNRPPLYTACLAAMQDIVEDLIECGADPNFVLNPRDCHRTVISTPLHAALCEDALSKSPKRCVAIARLLIKHGASLTSTHQSHNSAAWTACSGVRSLPETSRSMAMSALLDLFSENRCEKLLEFSEHTNFVSIHRAAATGDLEALKSELDAGVPADWATFGWPPQSPLHIAINNSHLEAAKLLVDYGSNVQVVSILRSREPRDFYYEMVTPSRQKTVQWLAQEVETRSKGYPFAETRSTLQVPFSKHGIHEQSRYPIFHQLIVSNVQCLGGRLKKISGQLSRLALAAAIISVILFFFPVNIVFFVRL